MARRGATGMLVGLAGIFLSISSTLYLARNVTSPLAWSEFPNGIIYGANIVSLAGGCLLVAWGLNQKTPGVVGRLGVGMALSWLVAAPATHYFYLADAFPEARTTMTVAGWLAFATAIPLLLLPWLTQRRIAGAAALTLSAVGRVVALSLASTGPLVFDATVVFDGIAVVGILGLAGATLLRDRIAGGVALTIVVASFTPHWLADPIFWQVVPVLSVTAGIALVPAVAFGIAAAVRNTWEQRAPAAWRHVEASATQ